MGRMRVQESQLRKMIRSWPEHEQGMVSFVEPAVGADTGLPDTLFLLKGHLVGIELKRGESVVKELRPSQRRWHRSTLHNGGQTYGLTLRNDDNVLLVAIHLSGGVMSDLLERKIMRCSQAEFSFETVSRAINAYSFTG